MVHENKAGVKRIFEDLGASFDVKLVRRKLKEASENKELVIRAKLVQLLFIDQIVEVHFRFEVLLDVERSLGQENQQVQIH